MYLRQRRGDAHGHVHHGAQRTDDYPRHQQAPQAQGRTRLPQLQQRFHIRQPQAVDPQKALGQQAEQQRQRRTGHRTQRSTHRLAAHAAQDHHRHHGDVGAHQKHRQQRGRSLHQQGDQDPEQAHQRHCQRHQRLGSHLAAHQHRCQQEQAHGHRQTHRPVILVHRGGMAAVAISGDQQHRPLPHLQGLAVQRPHIVIHLHGLALVLAGAHLCQQQLLPPIAAVGHGICLGIVRQDIRDDAGLVLGIFIPSGLGLLKGHSRHPHDDEQHQRRRQNDAAPPVPAPPGPGCQPVRIPLLPLHGRFLRQ